MQPSKSWDEKIIIRTFDLPAGLQFVLISPRLFYRCPYNDNESCTRHMSDTLVSLRLSLRCSTGKLGYNRDPILNLLSPLWCWKISLLGWWFEKARIFFRLPRVSWSIHSRRIADTDKQTRLNSASKSIRGSGTINPSLSSLLISLFFHCHNSPRSIGLEFRAKSGDFKCKFFRFIPFLNDNKSISNLLAGINRISGRSYRNLCSQTFRKI